MKNKTPILTSSVLVVATYHLHVSKTGKAINISFQTNKKNTKKEENGDVFNSSLSATAAIPSEKWADHCFPL